MVNEDCHAPVGSETQGSSSRKSPMCSTSSKRRTFAPRRRHRLAYLPLTLCFTHPALSALTTLPYEPLGHCPLVIPTLPVSDDARAICPDLSVTGTPSPSPWTFAPRCARDVVSQKEKYCVYTAGAFNDHAGTSIIAAPGSIPAELVKHPRLDHRTPLYLGTTSSVGTTTPEIAYITRSLVGKGIGTMAKRPIKRGQVFMVSHPAILIDTELERGPDKAITEADRLALHEVAFGQLADRERAAGLAASTGGDTWEDIMRTNGFGVTIGGRRYSGLFPEQARLNHACSPNSVIRFVQGTFALEAMAIRDVSAGEELTISYIPAGLTSAQRADHLSTGYNFTCTCRLCTAPANKIAASDTRRGLILNMRAHIFRTDSKPASTETKSDLPMAKELLKMVRAEPGLAELKLREWLGELAVLFAKRGEFEAALGFAREAVEQAEGLGEDGRGDGPGAVMRANLAYLERKVWEMGEVERLKGEEPVGWRT